MGYARRFTFPSFTFNKRYFCAIFLLLFIFIFISLPTSKICSELVFPISVLILPSIRRMCESELHALYLLKEQQLGLFKLWNRTFVTESNSNSNSTVVNPVNFTLNSSSALFEGFKYAVLSQISFNKQMQQVLLSSHQFGKSSDFEDNFTEPSLGSYASLDRCINPNQFGNSSDLEDKL